MKRLCQRFIILLAVFVLFSVCTSLAEPVENRSAFNPVRLTTLKYYMKGNGGALGFDFFTHDSYENYYTDVIYSWMDESDGQFYEVYDIDGKYHYFTATVASMYKDSGVKESRVGLIRIYGDDQLLWSDEHITYTTKPYDIQIDISNVVDLKFEIYANPSLKPMLANPLLLMDDSNFFTGAPDSPSPEAYNQAVELQTIDAYAKGNTALSAKTNAKDARGKEYAYVLYGYMTPDDGPSYDVYEIDGQYEFFTGTVGLLYNNSGLTEKATGIIRIYGDGRLLWSDECITVNNRSYDFTLYIGNVTDLKIEMYGDRCKSILANPTLLPAVN